MVCSEEVPDGAAAMPILLDYWGLAAWLAGVAGLVWALFIADRRWRRRQCHLESCTAVSNESRTFALNLVRHFMPSFQVQRYQFRGMRAKAGAADLEFRDLGLEACGKQVLQGVTGGFGAGRLCAVMGPSGAGKTSFVNALCGKAAYGKVSGTVLVNGAEVDISALRSVTGFVPQDDIVHQDLTVREQIEFSAWLRNGAGTSEATVQAIVEDVLNVMQVDHIQNVVVGSVEKRGISGGQRKRVSIGLELAAQPTVLFLDEPTTGLDATCALAVALSLKKMCELGTTSIMVAHQPRYSLFTLFDDVLLLGKGGRTAYLGPPQGARAYFEGLGFRAPALENPADWVMDVVSGDVPQAAEADGAVPDAAAADLRPEALFEAWRTKQAAAAEAASCEDCELGGGGGRGLLQRSGSRGMSAADDRAVLRRKLEEGWDQLVSDSGGDMNPEELRGVLEYCSGQQPSDDVVQELMKQMACPGAGVVTRTQFLDHFCSLGRLAIAEEESAAGAGEGLQVDAAGLSPAAALSLQGLRRDTPGFCGQYSVLLCRRSIQWHRINPQRALFLTALGLGGVVLAVLDRWVMVVPRWSAESLFNLHTCLALLLSIFCLQVFANDRPIFWRESASGISVPAFFLSRLHMSTVDVVLMTVVFTGSYFVVRQPLVDFTCFVVPFLLTAFASSGWGYFVSTVVQPKHGPFVVSLVIFIVCGVLGDPADLQNYLSGGVLEVVVNCLSITRWSVQMGFNYDYWCFDPRPQDPKHQAVLNIAKGVFFSEDFASRQLVPAAALIAMGTALRVASFLALRYMNREKQV